MDLTRRTVLLAGLAAAGVAVGAAATEGAAAVQTGKLPPPPPLDGELRFDEASRAAAADDFGHIVHRTPEGVLLPGSEQDVATTIRWAGGLGRKIAPQGQSHSVYGRAQVRAGIVIDMTRLQTVHRVQNDRVVVDAGAKWSEVLAATLPQGLTPPVLTDYLELSVGGTLVVGGIGGTTSQYGMQSDNVLELDVVTGTRREGHLFAGQQRRLVRCGACGPRTGGGHHQSDAQAHSSTGARAPIRADLPRLEDAADRRTAARR